MTASSETQWFYHRKHICIGCKGKDADTLAGRWYCRACSDRRNAIIRERRDPAKDKAIRADRRAKGICTRCGLRPADEGFVTCTKCRTYHRDVLNAYIQRKKKEANA